MFRVQIGSTATGALAVGLGLVACKETRKEGVEPNAPALAAQTQNESSSDTASAEATERDREALAALKRMGGFLLQQQSFSVTSANTTDEVPQAAAKPPIQLPGS